MTNVKIPEFELVGPPCKTPGCGGVLISGFSLNTLKLFNKCAICGEVSYRSPFDTLLSLFLVKFVYTPESVTVTRDYDFPASVLNSDYISLVSIGSQVTLSFHRLNQSLEDVLADMIRHSVADAVSHSSTIECMPKAATDLLGEYPVAILAHPDTPPEHYSAFTCPVIRHNYLTPGLVYACSSDPKRVGTVLGCHNTHAIVCWGSAGIAVLKSAENAG